MKSSQQPVARELYRTDLDRYLFTSSPARREVRAGEVDATPLAGGLRQRLGVRLRRWRATAGSPQVG